MMTFEYTPETVHEEVRQTEDTLLSLLYNDSCYRKTRNRKENIDPYKSGCYLTNSGMKKNSFLISMNYYNFI